MLWEPVSEQMPEDFWGELKRRFGRVEPVPEAAAGRRLKTYAAQTGFVYHYQVMEGAGFRFRVWRSGAEARMVTVELTVSGRGEGLIPRERYAVAKLALFRRFDEEDGLRETISVGEEEVAAHMEVLGLE